MKTTKTLFFALVMGFSLNSFSATYDELFPYYIQVCTGSQAKKKGQSPEWPVGHAFLYLKGACKDKSQGYPQLTQCLSSRSLSDPESGTLISVDSIVKNVAWVAIEGKALGFYGRLKPNEPLTKSYFDDLLVKVISEGYYNGIQIHEEPDRVRNPDAPFKDSTSDILKLAQNSVTYDFGISLGRDAYCTYVPINRGILGHLINYLNAENKKYFFGNLATGSEHIEFQWNYFSNNCAHFVYNVFAELGFWRKFKTHQPLPVQLFNLALPANVFSDVHHYLAQNRVPSPISAFTNSKMKRAFLENDWLPTGAGAVFEKIKFHEPNNLYDGNLDLWKLHTPFLYFDHADFKKIEADPYFNDLKINLANNIRVYEDVLNNQHEARACPEEWSLSKCEEFKAFGNKYFSFMARHLKELKDKLGVLGRTDSL